MNLSSFNISVEAGRKPEEELREALLKNLIVSGLCISINYINSVLVHTFRKHQV